MGRASSRKWEARLRSAVQQVILAQAKTPFWEKNLFWGPLGIALAILLMLVGYMKDVRWLLVISWVCLLISLWVATGDNIFSSRKRVCIFLTLVLISALGHYSLHVWLAPDSLSDEQLCVSTQVLSQRMRDFDMERQRQSRQMEQESRDRIMKAKSEDEKAKIGEENSKSLSRWIDDFQYDYEKRFMPKALEHRQQLLNRLPPQRVDSLINIDELTFNNIGPLGVHGASNKLEVLARMLCPQMYKETDHKS